LGQADAWQELFFERVKHMDMTEIAHRLEVKFGLGTRPDLRRSLYRDLEGIVESHGPEAYIIIASAAVDSEGKEHPGRYFARVVKLRLMERGILQAPAL
jgi:hypothetical protein